MLFPNNHKSHLQNQLIKQVDMEITIKIKLDSGKELELSESEYQELQEKLGKLVEIPKFIPYVPDPWPGYPNYPTYPWYKITCSDNTSVLSEQS
jgi:hypothetical protein